MSAPLTGLRVLELGVGVAAPYAGRLLSMLGATVVKLEPESGDPARAAPVDGRPLRGTSPLFLHLNLGKRNVAGDAVAPEDALRWADVVLDSRVRAQVADTPLDPAVLRRAHPHALPASVTAWGFEADTAGRMEDELLVQAASGMIGITGEPDGPPLRLPGWQSQYLAGAYTAAAVLATLQGQGGPPPHLDIAWLSCAITGVEGGFERFLYTDADPTPPGAHAPAVFPSGAIRCADGHVAPGTVRQRDWELQCLLYAMPELLDDERFQTPAKRAAHYEQLWSLIQPWYDIHAKHEIFRHSLELGLAMGMVMTTGEALTDAHLAERRFLATHTGPDGAFVAPARPFIIPGLEPANARVAQPGEDSAWFRAQVGSTTRRDVRGPAQRALPLSGLRVVELTTAWAGPFVGRFLGALGADVIKVESARSYDLWRGPVGVEPEAPGPYPGGVAGGRPYDRAANFNALNRNKRGVSLDLTTPEGHALLLRLVERTDAVVSNFTARVLPNLGLGYEVLRAVKRDVILLSMPALGASGPYAHAAGYGTIIEAMGGLGARFGGREEGARISQTYYPDAVAGIHGALALLAALAHRSATGEGAFIDLSQQEAMWLQLGEGIVLRSTEGREPERLGNAEPGCTLSGIYATADRGWVAIAVRSDPALQRLAALAGGDPAMEQDALDRAVAGWTRGMTRTGLLHALRNAEIPAAPACTYREASTAPELERIDAFERLTHPAAGGQRYLRVPLRLDGAPISSSKPAPCFDEHTDEVLAQWAGATPDEVAALRRSGVIGHRPVG